LAELLNAVLDKGVIVHGDVTLAVADIDLVKLNLGLLLSAFETVDRRQRTPGAQSLAQRFGPPQFGSPVPPAPIDRTSEAANVVEKSPSSTADLSKGPAEGKRMTALNDVAQGLPERINADAAGVESGLARLVLTLIEVLRKVLEHQAIRRMDGGTLTPAEVERLGLALSRLHGRMQELQAVFGLTDDDLHIDLGPLGRVR
jgi:hypothetical protein